MHAVMLFADLHVAFLFTPGFGGVNITISAFLRGLHSLFVCLLLLADFS